MPEGWAWCRLGEIGVLERGITFPSSAKELSPEKNNIPCLRTANVQNNLDFSNLIYVNKVYLRNNHNKLLKKNDIILSSANSRELVGKTAFVYDIIDEMTFGGFVVVIRSFINNYLFYFLRREFFSGKFMEKSTQTTNIANIKTDTLANYFVPLPPLSEQHHIVAKIEAIFAQIDLLEQNKTDLQTAVKQAKSKILDLAIRGKLVPQDPADEPASVMLEKLRAEKEAKIASGEIKRGKNDSYIYKNSTDNCYYEKFEGAEEQIEIPFDLPEGWCWQKISSICEINPKNKLDNTLEVSFVPMTLIDSEFNNNFTYELQRWETVKSGFSHFADNDIGIAKITPCFENRKSVIFKNLKNKYGAGTTELHILRTNNEYIFNEYVFWFIKTDTFIKEGINNFTGAVGQQRIGKEFIAETLIPIPPLNEQVKICRTINKLMKKLDETSLNIV